MNDFKNLKGLPPDKLPYKSKVPKELEYKHVDVKENPKLNWKDLLNILLAYVRKDVLKTLNPAEKQGLDKMLSGFAGAFLVIIIILIILLVAT